MSLTDRINNPDRRLEVPVVPVVERRGGTERRLPEWLRRQQGGVLPAKDLTGSSAA